MIRLLLLYALPLVAPLAVYTAWQILAQRRTGAAGAGDYDWRQSPWHWLALAGVGLSAIVAVTLVQFGRSGTTGTYEPPRVVDGEIVPGRVVPSEP